MNALAVFAHPDDETMLCGGILALLAKESWKVHYLCATRGEGGEVGDPPVCSIETLGSVREAELVAAVGALGGSSLTFLGYVDPRVGPDDQLYPFEANLTMFAGQIAASIRQFGVDAVFTHGSNGEYGHPAHLLTHQGTAVAVASLGEQAPLFYTAAAAYPSHPRPRLANKDDPADLIVDVSQEKERKTRAAMSHATQHALFVCRQSKELGRTMSVPEVILLEESLHRVYPRLKDGETPTDAVTASLAKYCKA